MKKYMYFVVLLFLPVFSFAQNRVDAQEIIAKINKGEAVNYQNVQVTGDLDFTRLQNRQVQKDKNNDWGSDHTNYVSTVKSPLQFVNCTFSGNVIAYYSVPNGNETNNANFEQEVRFEKCVFQQASAFKYSEFDKTVSFAGSTFNEEALFKYSKFPVSANFSNAKFEEIANFKYVKFPKDVTFKGASFKEEANFKYASFTQGVNFNNTTFDNYADFKYAKFSQPLNLSGVSFSGNEDFKYAKVDGKKFASYLLQNK